MVIALCLKLLLMMHVYKQDGRTPLMVAAWKGRLKIVMELLRAGAHANTQDQVCMDEVRDLYNHVCWYVAGGAHFTHVSYAKCTLRSGRSTT